MEICAGRRRSRHLLQGIAEYSQRLSTLVRRDYQGRDEAQCLKDARRENDRTPSEARLRHCSGKAFRHFCGIEVHADHEARTSNFFDRISLALHGEQPLCDLAPTFFDVCQNAVIQHHLNGCVGRRTRHSVTRVRPALASPRLFVHQFLAGRDTGEREPGCDALRKHENVRMHTIVFDSKHLACAPKAALDLIGDEEQCMTVAKVADPFHETRRRGHITALAEDRLDDHRRCF
mmetsp:Transcript_77009/g.214130  ORF Transcript_77009/g.214130 Transcript_77009/m.214130 type:complete len:233 (+) Transcript_77009:78-776(+)